MMEKFESLGEFLKVVFRDMKKETYIEFKAFSNKDNGLIEGVIKYVNSRRYYRISNNFDSQEKYEQWIKEKRLELENEFAKEKLFFEKLGEQHYKLTDILKR